MERWLERARRRASSRPGEQRCARRRVLRKRVSLGRASTIVLPMRNVFWLLPHRLGGRPGPDRAAWDLRLLRDAGVGAVLSVNDGLLCHPPDFAAAGIAYACVPLADNAPPQLGDEQVCLEALPKAYAFVAEQLARDRVTLVHCSSGKDRTGLLLAYWSMRAEGHSAEAAIDRVRSVRPIAFTAIGWDELALDVLRGCGARCQSAF